MLLGGLTLLDFMAEFIIISFGMEDDHDSDHQVPGAFGEQIKTALPPMSDEEIQGRFAAFLDANGQQEEEVRCFCLNQFISSRHRKQEQKTHALEKALALLMATEEFQQHVSSVMPDFALPNYHQLFVADVPLLPPSDVRRESVWLPTVVISGNKGMYVHS